MHNPIPKGCKYTVPNTAYVHKGHNKVGWKFWAKGSGAVEQLFAVMEWKDIATFYRNLGYDVHAVGTATKSVMLAHLGNQDIAVWGFVGHGAEGILWAADPAETNDDLVGLSAYEARGAQHHRLAEVILYACEGKRELRVEAHG